MEDPGRLDMEVVDNKLEQVDNKVDKAPSLTINRVIWILASDTQPTYLHILTRQCCLQQGGAGGQQSQLKTVSFLLMW